MHRGARCLRYLRAHFSSLGFENSPFAESWSYLFTEVCIVK